jgi:heptosyltransferase III
VRVIVIFPGALGDFCLLVPSLAALLAKGAVVAVSVQRALEPLATTLLPAITLGPPIDGVAMASLFAGDLASDLRTWLGGADRVHAWLGYGEVTARLAAACDVRPSMHVVPRGDDGPHAGDEYAAACGVRPAEAGWSPAPNDSASLVRWRVPPSARLLVHPGAGSRAKCWSADGFRAVADAWVAAGGEAVVVLGPAEQDDVARWQLSSHAVLTDLDLTTAAAAIASAACWLGNDAGMTQLAGLLMRRGVVLFGPTRPERWRPRGGALEVVTFAGRPTAEVVRDVRSVLGHAFAHRSA